MFKRETTAGNYLMPEGNEKGRPMGGLFRWVSR
jgi:hypothetical protein